LILLHSSSRFDAAGSGTIGLIQANTPFVSFLVAGTLAVGTGCSAAAQTSQAHLGEKVTTRPGNVVTVYGWRSSGLDLKSCRTDRHAVVLDAGGFTVRTVGGAVLQASGSNFTAVGNDCVTGQIFFHVPAGDEPEYALDRAGSKLLRWRITTRAGSGSSTVESGNGSR
jgi:hypothetical protein